MNPKFPDTMQRNKFRRFFGAELMDYFDPLTGFDLVKFDDQVIKSKDGESAKDVVHTLGGDDAVDLVIALLMM